MVSISKGNTKMGQIQSISLPSVETCRPCACSKKCYARRIERMRSSVASAYRNNLRILKEAPEVFWREVEAAIMMSRYFRFHVSGDIPDSAYFEKMVEIAKRQQHCQILCFTKKFEIVNEYIFKNGVYDSIPQNLHIVFSGWVDLTMVNPFSLPEAHVRYRDGTTTASEGAIECGGNCTECAMVNAGCWTLKSGEQVVFNEH